MFKKLRKKLLTKIMYNLYDIMKEEATKEETNMYRMLEDRPVGASMKGKFNTILKVGEHTYQGNRTLTF